MTVAGIGSETVVVFFTSSSDERSWLALAVDAHVSTTFGITAASQTSSHREGHEAEKDEERERDGFLHHLFFSSFFVSGLLRTVVARERRGKQENEQKEACGNPINEEGRKLWLLAIGLCQTLRPIE